MKFTIQLLKQLFFVIIEVLWTIVKTAMVPIYTTTVKMLLVSLCLLLLCKYVPHDLPYINDVSFIGWLSIIAVYRLVTLKYDDFNDEVEPELVEPPTPNYLGGDEEPTSEQEELIDVPPPPRNVGLKANDRTTSTRE